MNVVFILLISSSVGFLKATQPPYQKVLRRQEEEQPFNPLIRLPRQFNFLINFNDETMNNDTINENISKFLSACTHLCPSEDPRINERISKGSIQVLNCLSELQSESESDYEKTENCQTEVQPVIRKTLNKCGPKIDDQEIYIYQFVYRECTILNLEHEKEKKINSQEFITVEYDEADKLLKKANTRVYEFCFNTTTNKVVYTWHKLWWTELLKKVQALGKLAFYESDTKSTEPYGIFENVFNVIAQEFREEMDNNKDLALHMMVPPEHLAFGLWKKTAYHYANVKLMKSIDIEFWKYIDEHIRRKAIEMDVEFNVYMRDFKIPGGDESEIIWVKIIYDEKLNNGATILVYDKPTSEENSPQGKRSIRKQLCSGKYNEKCFQHNPPSKNGEEFNKRVVCCWILQEHRDIFNIQMPFYEYIAIDKPEDDKKRSIDSVVDMDEDGKRQRTTTNAEW